MENYQQEPSEVRGFLPNRFKGFLLKAGQGDHTSPGVWWEWGTQSDIEGDQTSGVGVSLNWLSRSLAKMGQCRDEHRSLKVEAYLRKSEKSLSRVWSRGDLCRFLCLGEGCRYYLVDAISVSICRVWPLLLTGWRREGSLWVQRDKHTTPFLWLWLIPFPSRVSWPKG